MPVSLITLLITAGLQYGPEFVMSIIAIIENPNASVNDVKLAFANLKPYSAYGIPNIPIGTATPLPTVA
jgi:hypothetical protein